MKNAILKFLVSKLGGVVTYVVGIAVGAGIAKLTTLSPELAAQVDPGAVTLFVSTAIIGAVNSYTNKQSSDGVKAIQAVVGVPQTGVPEMTTYVEVRKATLP